MKTKLTLIALMFCLQLSAQKGKNKISHEDYVALAGDICTCVESNAVGLSPGMREVLIKSGSDPLQLGPLMDEFMEEHLEEGMSDITIIQKIGAGLNATNKNREEKYKHIYSSESGERILATLIEILSEDTNCELTLAFMMIGIDSEDDGESIQGEYNEDTEILDVE